MSVRSTSVLVVCALLALGFVTAGCGSDGDEAASASAAASAHSSADKTATGSSDLRFYSSREVQPVAYRDRDSALSASGGSLPDGATIVTADPSMVPFPVKGSAKFDRSTGVFMVLRSKPLVIDRSEIEGVSVSDAVPPNVPVTPDGAPSDQASDQRLVEMTLSDAAQARLASFMKRATATSDPAVPMPSMLIVLDGKVVAAPPLPPAGLPTPEKLNLGAYRASEAEEVRRKLA